MNEEREAKTFKVTDKRFSAKHEEVREASPPQEKIAGEKEGPTAEKKRFEEKQEFRAETLPEINFATFVISLSTQAMLHFGDFSDPATKETKKNLPLAKQTIDILSMLQEKTKGNLHSEESHLLDNILYELRMRYINECK